MNESVVVVDESVKGAVKLRSLHPLSREEKKRFEALTGSEKSETDEVQKKGAYEITLKDLRQLQGSNHVGDEVLNSMFHAINERNTAYHECFVPCSEEQVFRPYSSDTLLDAHDGGRGRLHVVHTHFLELLCPEHNVEKGSASKKGSKKSSKKGSKKRSPRRMDSYNYDGVKSVLRAAKLSIDMFDKIVVPIFLRKKQHWALVLIYIAQEGFFYIDSLHNEDDEDVMPSIRRWVTDEARQTEIRDESLRASLRRAKDWKCEMNPPYIPRQEDLDACGIFVIYYTYFLELGLKPSFTQDDVETLRIRTGLYLCDGKIPEREEMEKE